MSIKKDGDKWIVDVRPSGRSGKRYRRKFDKKSEALAYEKHILATAHNKEWLGLPVDKRPLSELIALWWKKAGQFKRTSTDYHNRLLSLCKELGDPPVSTITQSLIMDWQTSRLESGNKPSTVRRTLNRLSNVFTELIATGDYTGEHPIKGVKRPAVIEPEMSFLTKKQIGKLLEAVAFDSDLEKVVKICLATGSRWTETVTLTSSNLTPHRIRFTNTKTGKPRTIPISQKLYDEIYPNDGGALFATNPQKVLWRVLSELDFNLPKGQKGHVLRHTFASHFMMNGGSILTLNKILDHSSIQQTMTYAHLAPDHLQDAITFNPLEK